MDELNFMMFLHFRILNHLRIFFFRFEINDSHIFNAFHDIEILDIAHLTESL